MWEIASDGSMWFYPNAIITTPPDSPPLNFRTNLQTTEGDVQITVSISVNDNVCMVRVEDRWFIHHIVQKYSITPEEMRATYCNYSRP